MKFEKQELYASPQQILDITVGNDGVIYCISGGGVASVADDLYQVDHGITELLFHDSQAQMTAIVFHNNVLYIYCWQNKLLEYDLATRWTKMYPIPEPEHLFVPRCIAVDPHKDKLYIACGDTVQQIDIHSKKSIVWFTAEDRFRFNPKGIALGRDGAIYAAEISNECIRKIKDGVLSIVAGTGEKGYKDGPLTEAKFDFPSYIILDFDGSFLVADSRGLRRIDLQTGQVSTPPQLNHLARCGALSIDKNGDIYMASGNSIVIIEDTWKWERLLWIGKLKEDPKQCCISKLPVDMVKEIIGHYCRSKKWVEKKQQREREHEGVNCQTQ